MPKRALKVLILATVVAVGTALVAPPASSVPAASSGISFTSGTLARIGEYNWLSVAIGTSTGTRPSGAVQFFNTDGAIVGTASTSASGTSGATASIPWFPTEERTYSFNATFISDNPAVTGSSTTVPFTVFATPSGQPLSISVPQLYQGIPATIVATVYPSSLEGSVGFSVNEAKYGVGPSVPVVKGLATQTFTPTMRGWNQFIASFTATNSPGTQGAVGQWVNVLPPIGTDDITLIPAVSSLYRYQKVAFTVSTTAGAPVTLTATGGCVLDGTILTATKKSGTCVVTGTSPSTGGYLGTTESWTIALTPRPKK